jgi:hypothetical protein
MAKPTITRLFFGSLIALIAGAITLVVALIWAFGSGAFIMDGHDVVGVETSGIGWSLIGLAIVGTLAAIGGAIGQFVAWIGALLNTSHLEDKTWFVLLLVLGLLSFGFVAMLVYVIVGPDGTTTTESRHVHAGGAA